VDVFQGQSDVGNTEALIQQLEIPLRQATNRLCILLGLPPEDIIRKLGEKPIPVAPPAVVVGVPADLLRRRPDVRRAERHAAAQCAQIGVAVSELYPHISIEGSFGWSAQNFPGLFAGDALRGVIGPTFKWNILNYGRLQSNIKVQDAKFQELVVSYQNTALKAGEEVENGLVTFLRAQQRTRSQTEAVNSEMDAFKQALAQYKGGLVDYNRVVLIQERLVERQQTLAEAQGQIALGLIQVYRALGGGWQIRCASEGPELPGQPDDATARNPLPVAKLPMLDAVPDKPAPRAAAHTELKPASGPSLQ
jgi:outer membrane protein TolC